MSLNMSMEATKEYVELKAKRYRLLRGKKAKGQILNEVVETTGYDRKHAIRLLGSYASCKVLAPFKIIRNTPRGPTKGLRAIQAEIPIRQGSWSAEGCGWIEGDTVAHCGSSMKGSFIWTLTLTDIMSQWTELGATCN